MRVENFGALSWDTLMVWLLTGVVILVVVIVLIQLSSASKPSRQEKGPFFGANASDGPDGDSADGGAS